MQKLAPACGVTIPDQCPRPDGSDVTGTLVIANFDDVSFGALTELQKTNFRTKITEDIAKDTGVDKTGIAISTLAHLDLRWNKIGAEGAGRLAAVLGQCASLAHLDLHGNEIGAEGAGRLAEVLGKCASIAHLDLGGN